MAIREGKWRCPYCSGVNRGAHLACGGCGATRDKDVTFFLEDDAPEVADEALLARARAGADWLCLFCGASNPPDRGQCRNCGGGRGAAPSRPVVEEGAGMRSERSEDPLARLPEGEARSNPAPLVIEPGDASGAPPGIRGATLARRVVYAGLALVSLRSTSRPPRPPARSAGMNPAPLIIEPGGASGAPPGPPARSAGMNPAPLAAVTRRFRPVVTTVLLLLVAFVAAAAYFGLRRSEETLTVAGFEWERKVAVEAWRTVRERAWEGSVPSQARVVSRRQEVHHTERDQVGTRRVKAGTRDLGNGFFEDVYRDEPFYRERPVHRTRVTYDIQRWVPDRTVQASGQDHAARWPDPALRAGEREVSRSEKLVVVLNGKRTYRMELPEAHWAALQPGQPVNAVMRGGWSVLELKQ